ncbi:hypothetical protein [Novosphingobium pentaromativorans]|nr:hypothetical protein [Novosphingobium pentaromativorans]
MSARHRVERSAAVSSVEVRDAPAGATVQVGDTAVRADDKGRAQLALADGWHDLYVFSGQKQIHHQRIFLQDGSRKVIDLIP